MTAALACRASSSAPLLWDHAVPQHESLDTPALSSQQCGLTDGGTLDLCFLPCGSRSGAPWYCIQTHPSAELEADWHLRNQGFATYLPQVQTVRQNRQTKIVPLFPGYLFAQITERSPSWGPMRSTRGVATVLVMPGTADPAEVPHAALLEFWRQCEPNGVIYPSKPIRPPLDLTGRQVQVTGGPFAALAGICQHSARDRVTILLSIFGRTTAVQVGRSEVKAIG